MAQDVILKQDGSEVKAKVEEITVDMVKYRQWDNLAGPIYNMPKAEIFKINYANGKSDFFGNIKKSEVVKSLPSNYDSLMKLSKSNKVAGIIGLTLGPVFLIAGATCTALGIVDYQTYNSPVFVNNNNKLLIAKLNIAQGVIYLAGGTALTILGPIALIKSRQQKEAANAAKTGAILYYPSPVTNSAGRGFGVGWRMNF